MTVVLDGKVWSTLACCLAVSVAAPAMANDSASELAAGGLVLTRTDAIAMQREDLTLAPDEVTVRYEMRNDTGKPVTLRVAPGAAAVVLRNRSDDEADRRQRRRANDPPGVTKTPRGGWRR